MGTVIRAMWIKHVILDLAATALIVIATIPEPAWARWLVVAYTILMVILKLMALAGGRAMRALKPSDRDVPSWFWHVSYGVNVGLLLADSWWLPAAGWILIWLLSIIFERRAAAHSGA